MQNTNFKLFGKVPKMTNKDLSEYKLVQLFERLLDACHAEGLFHNCTKCVHWIPGNPIGIDGKPITTANDNMSPPETCRKYKMRPPATVIVKGCPSFCLDEIPF